MKDLKKYIQNIVLEAKSLKVKPEAPKDAPMEKFLFSPQRDDDCPKEKNTKFEDKLYGELVSHLGDNEGTISIKMAQIIIDCINKGYYKNFFKEPTETVYRGLIVNDKVIRKILNLSNNEIVPQKGKRKISTILTNKNNKLTASWTSSIDVAKKFSTVNFIEEDNYSVILEANPNENHNKFIELTQEFYEINEDFSEYYYEDEIIGLSDIKLSSVKWKLVHPKK